MKQKPKETVSKSILSVSSYTAPIFLTFNAIGSSPTSEPMLIGYQMMIMQQNGTYESEYELHEVQLMIQEGHKIKCNTI